MKPYWDDSTGGWVGEFETRDDEGQVSRKTEWFDTEAEAAVFAEKGDPS